MPRYQRIAIIGVGLLGGSIGKAIRQRKLASEVVGIGRRQSSLDAALEIGAVDRATLNLKEGVAGSELIVVATPVDQIAPLALAAAKAAPESLLTDAGSTKASICESILSADPELASRFVGSHPLAGGHRSGPEHADGDLLLARTVVVTPFASTPPEIAAKISDFWRLLGAIVKQMTPAEHDQALAATSHLPHLAAFALSGATPEEFLPLAATGWSDTTRIAASDPALWRQIFATNREALLDALTRYEDNLGLLRQACEQQDWSTLEKHLQNAQRIRNALGD
ncbi:prephenate dehydrogenase [Adhaeretor mobilis]|uniref:Prephenate dehydrogenase n=1 Tax=Adhaeretor mobilis TaxID=1930276 RepID=A0A517MU90_9BACT|nr:prephenate dehydrogenase/arogenate dehydrogenase family protein [Adhaeretor mobilis]QDS98357.1 prephenate dehydrogenase [Adhaeretor mobilis]